MEAIESVYKQTYTGWEIIIVDDKSTDNSREVYETLKNNPRIQIFYNEENKGVGYTKKRCIDEAHGEICGFLDPDDALVNNAIEVMIKSHTDNPETSLIHSKTYNCDSNLNIIKEYDLAKQVPQNDPLFLNLDYSIFHFATFKLSFYLKTAGLNSFMK